MKANLKLNWYPHNGCSLWSLRFVLLNGTSKIKLPQEGERAWTSVTRKNAKAEHTTLSPSPDFAKTGRFDDGQTSWEERQQQTLVEHVKEPSSLEKRLGCRVVGQWLQVLEEVPERGQDRARVADPWVVHRRESE